MNTYTDGYLEYYADRFINLRIARHGFNLVQYLANPVVIERLALEPEPLLPAQHTVVLKIWHAWDTGLATVPEPDEEPFELPGEYAVWEEFLLEIGNNKAIRQRNGAFVEPLRHHRHNRGMSRQTANFERRQARKGA